MATISTVFFDWGGVIADDPGDDFLKVLLQESGATDQQIEEIYSSTMREFMCGRISEADYWGVLKRDFGLNIRPDISDEFHRWSGLIKNEDVYSLIDKLKTQKIKVALLTNVIEPTYNVLSEAGYYMPFDSVIASCKVGYAKPQPEIYSYALTNIKSTAAASLFIDDKQKNLDPAISLGFKTILAKNPTQIISDINAIVG